MKRRLKIAAMRMVWGGLLLFGALNTPFLGALVLLLLAYPLYQLGLIPDRFTTSGKDVQIWFGGIELETLDATIFYFLLCAFAAFVIGLIVPPRRKRPSVERIGER